MINFISDNYVFLLLIGILMTVAGIYKSLEIEKIKNIGTKTDAHIIDYKVTVDTTSDSSNKTWYNPIVKFNDAKGNPRSIIYDIGTTFKPNTMLPKRVEISYIENKGIVKMVIIDDKLTDYFSMGMLLLGLIITISTLFIYFYKNI